MAKSINMSMLAKFLEVRERSEELFSKLNIGRPEYSKLRESY